MRMRSLVALLVLLASCTSTRDNRDVPADQPRLPHGRTVITQGILPPAGNPPKASHWRFVVIVAEQRFCMRLEYESGVSSAGCDPKGQPINPALTFDVVERVGVAAQLDHKPSATLIWGVAGKRIAKIKAEFAPDAVFVDTFERPGFPIRFFVRQVGASCQRPFVAALDATDAQVTRARPGITGSC